jgi:gliding motility-associated-like protein
MTLPVIGQVELKLQLQQDGVTYTAFVRSQSDLLPPIFNITHSAQVIVMVPTGGFEVEDLVNHAGQWQLSNIIQHPSENPSVDYVMFSLEGPTSELVYEAGLELPLFSFKNKFGCTGDFRIMDPAADPFLPPNSLNLTMRTELIIEGVGAANAVIGIYGDGEADCFRLSKCLLANELELLPDNFYQISLVVDSAFIAPANLKMLQVAVKVPTNFFQIKNLTKLLPGQFSFGNTTRFDSPSEDDDHDYIQFRLNATGLGLALQPGTKYPVLKFANGGSCQGDSIFLVKNEDPFLPPNSQAASIGHTAQFFGSDASTAICPSAQAAAPCVGCLFTDGLIKLDSVQHADPVVCLGGANGMIKLFAHGTSNMQYSIDGGQNWSSNGYFPGLVAGNYQPQVRGTKFGCPVSDSGQPIELQPSTSVELKLEAPAAVCEGSDVPLKITSPSPLPANASFAWSGPQGFSQNFSDPIILNVNSYQSGNYTLLLTAPGCDPASATTNLQVNPQPVAPDILSNGPICFGEKLQVFSSASGAKFEWYSPLGASGLALPDLTTSASETFVEPSSPAYLSGIWQVKVTDDNGCSAMSQSLAIYIKPRPQAFAETTGPVCPGGQAQLLSNPLPGATYEWKVQGESTIFSMQSNPLINNVLVPQTYQLVVWQDGCVSIVPAFATVSLNPLPSLSPQQQYAAAPDCSPKPLSLMANASGTGLSYNWSGPNGFSSQAANPVIPAANAAANGSYTVKVSNVFGCSATQSVLVSGITDPVAMPLVQSTGPACPGDDVQLSTQTYAGSQVSYQWYKANTPLSGQTSNTLIFNAIQPVSEGNYKVRVAVGACIVESASQFLDVLDPPQPYPDFFLSQPCEGGTLQFFSNTNGIASWQWTGPAGFVSDSPTPVIYQTQLGSIGAYQLTVTGTNGCTANGNLLIDGILPVPEAPVVASNSPVCPGAEIQLTVQNPINSGGNVNYLWQNANGEYIGSGTPSLTLSASDPLAVPPFLVKTIVNTCPSPLSNPVSVQVLPAPTAIAWNGGAVCAGATAQLFAATQPNVSYEWQVAGQVVSIEQNPVLPLTDTTDFQLVVKTNGCTASAFATTQVAVNPLPVISNLSSNTVVCQGSPLSLSASNTVPLTHPVQYTWTGPSGYLFTGTAAPSGPFPLAFAAVAPQNEGSYTLTLTSAEGCVSTSQSVSVEVGSMPPTPTVTVADALLCEGETLQLDATPATGSLVSYDWYFNDGSSNTLLATTSFPTYFLPSVMPSNTGSYFVKTTADGCQTQASNLAPLTVLTLPTSVSATNPTTSLTPACEGENVQLSATLLPGANYHWYGPAGFYANVPNPVLNSVQTAQSGDFLVVVSYPACTVSLAAETAVFVMDTPAAPILAGTSTACEGTAVVLSVANPTAGAAYDFYFGQNGQPFLSGSVAAVLENVDATFAGNYFVSATLNGCPSPLSSAFAFQVVPAQTGIAFAGDDQTICEANKIPLLQASPPAVGEGNWTSLDGATVVQPNSAHSTAIGLLPGENRFVWTLTNGLCPGVGSDTVAVFLENIKAVSDYYSLPLNDSLLNINLLENDFTQNLPDFEFMILAKPNKGQLLESGDGLVTYIPYPNAFGEDGFRYRICSMSCPDVCDEATVHISLDGSVTASDCFRPNLITPDGDGLDDVFVIPCAAGWPGSSILIFNRWGSTVFESSDYQNDWGGTYNGQPLPPSTYFYQLRLNDGKGTVLQGFVVVE